MVVPPPRPPPRPPRPYRFLCDRSTGQSISRIDFIFATGHWDDEDTTPIDFDRNSVISDSSAAIFLPKTAILSNKRHFLKSVQ